MKKNIRLNKQIIKALSVGISASMLLQPVSAMAAEVEETPVAEPNTESSTVTSTENVYDVAEGHAEETDGAVEDAIQASHDAIDAVGEGAAEEVVEAAEAFEETVSNNEAILADDIADELADSDDAKEVIEEMEVQKALVDAIAVSGNDAGSAANSAAETAATIEVSANDVAETAEKAVDDAKTFVDEQEEAMKNAGSADEAKAIYDTIVDSISGADTAVSNAETEYAALESAYNDAYAEYTTKNGLYEAAETVLQQAIQDYNDLVDAGVDDTADAYTRLEELKAKATALKEEAQTAYNNYIAQGYGYIAYHEELCKDAVANTPEGGNVWNDVRDPLFEAMIKYYYVPDMKGAGYEFVSATWTKFPGNDSLNYCTVVYRDSEGNEYTELLNYRLSNHNWAGGFVIFEKTEHLFYGNTDFTADEKAALDRGEAVIRDGLAVYKNEEGEYVVYEDSEKTSIVDVAVVEGITVKTDENGTEVKTEVDVDDENATVTYQVNEDGHLVKTVSADVTTTTFTGASLSASSVDMADEAAAKAAYVEALQGVLDSLDEGEVIVIGQTEIGKDYVIDAENPIGFRLTEYTDNVVTGYTVSGTYNEKFTKKIDISGKKENSIINWRVSKDEAREAYYDKAYDVIDGFDFDITYLDFDGRQTDYVLHNKSIAEPTITGDSSCRYYSGSVTVTYSDVKSKVCDRDWFIFTGLGISDSEISEELAKEGKIYLGRTSFGDGLDEFTIYYVDAVKVNEEVAADSESAAVAAFKEAIGSDYYNEHLTATANTQEVTTYGYDELAYFIKLVNRDRLNVSTTEWVQIIGNCDIEYRNDKLDAGDIILAEYDYTYKKDYISDDGSEHDLPESDVKNTSDFRNKVDNAARIIAMYQDIAQQCTDAEEAIEVAKTKVNDLQAEIRKLRITGELDKVKAFEADLNDAWDTLQRAIEKRDDLVDRLEDIQEELDDVIDDLTDDDTPTTGGPTGPSGPDNPIDAPETFTDVITVVPVTPTVPFAAPGPVAVADIPEDDVALAAEPLDVVDETPVVVEDDDVALAAAPVTIGDDVTPLAALPEEAQMPWWWLLIILVLGATGAEMYRRYQAKKKAAEISEDNK
ncbi:MAG: hypothetical protein J6Z09_08600 [Lachnospiraceae bacterium]|nr:hypothetical protein [Lachnospiraceae bacterium]